MPEGRLQEAKRRLRSALAARRRALPAEVARAAANACTAHLMGHPRVARARCVALYAALPDELPTRPLFEALAAAGIARSLPRWAGVGLEFAGVESWESLVPGRFGVLEPPADAPGLAPDAFDLVVVPGVAFDARGGRLGRGGGAYDRSFPPGRSAPPLVGLAYAFQVVASVPCGSRDRRVDAIVTEEGLVWIAEGPRAAGTREGKGEREG